MKLLLIIAALIISDYSYGQQREEIKIPQGIKYNYCDNQTLEKAKQLISENLSDRTKFTLSQKTLIVGPQLWNRFKEIKRLNEIEGGNTTIHSDDRELPAKMTRDLNDAKKVWDEFRKEIKGNYIIRKANEQELIYYWSVISFDIDEPLLIVETKEHNYILNILKDDLKLMWLDEAPIKKGYFNPIENQTYEATNGFKADQNGLEVDSLSVGIKETKLERVVFLSGDKELKDNTSVEDISSIAEKTSVIFEELFKNSKKAGKIMLQFELKKSSNEIQFAVRDNIDLEIMKEFERRIKLEKYPNSKKDPVKFQLIYKVNSLNDTE